MKITSVTVGIPVRNLDAAMAWYQRAFDLGSPDLTPLPGLAEYDLGSFWLQLAESPHLAGIEGVSVNISVDDAAAARARFISLGLTVTELEHIEGVVDVFQLLDPDGNTIGFVTELG